MGEKIILISVLISFVVYAVMNLMALFNFTDKPIEKRKRASRIIIKLWLFIFMLFPAFFIILAFVVDDHADSHLHNYNSIVEEMMTIMIITAIFAISTILIGAGGMITLLSCLAFHSWRKNVDIEMKRLEVEIPQRERLDDLYVGDNSS